jgi:circadian clock protein KaiC
VRLLLKGTARCAEEAGGFGGAADTATAHRHRQRFTGAGIAARWRSAGSVGDPRSAVASSSVRPGSALQFIAQGIKQDELCLYLSFQQSAPQLITRGQAFGWLFGDAVDAGVLQIRHLEPVEISLDAIGAELRRAAAAERPFRRVVIDSLAGLEPAARGTGRFPDYLSALTSLFASVGASTLLTSETSAFFGPSFELSQGLAFVADNVILFRYAELESEVRRAMAIIKMRNGDHIRDIVEVVIDATGLSVKGKFTGMTGILAGTPTVSPAASRPRDP